MGSTYEFRPITRILSAVQEFSNRKWNGGSFVVFCNGKVTELRQLGELNMSSPERRPVAASPDASTRSLPSKALNTQKAFAWRAHERATALSLSREDVHARLPRARAVPRWAWSFHALYESTAPARGLSLSVQDHTATCQLRPPTHSRLSRGAHVSEPLRSPALRRRRSTRACDACALCRAGCTRSTPYKRALRQREASLLRWKTLIRRASCGFQHTATFCMA